MQWIKSVSRVGNSFIDLVFVEGAAHAAFLGPLSIDTKNFGNGPIGWSLGGSLDSQKKMMSEIMKFIRETDK